MGRAVAAMTLALVLAPIVNVRGDGPLHELLAELDQKIAKSTITDPTLHIRRGSLLLQDGQRERATADFVVATSNLGVDPKTTLSLAHFAYRLERFDTALELVSRYPSSAPHEASARVLRARTLRALKQILAAIAEFDRAIAATREPQLSLYLERHRLYLQAPPETRAQAIVGLRQGIKIMRSKEMAAVVSGPMPKNDFTDGTTDEELEAIAQQMDAIEAWRALGSPDDHPASLRGCMASDDKDDIVKKNGLKQMPQKCQMISKSAFVFNRTCRTSSYRQSAFTRVTAN